MSRSGNESSRFGDTAQLASVASISRPRDDGCLIP